MTTAAPVRQPQANSVRRRAYELRSETGAPWRQIARTLRMADPHTALLEAKRYAKAWDMKWPLERKR